MATVTGYVERIKYRNEDNGYSVLSVADAWGGICPRRRSLISARERIEATGRMVEHSIYGEQLAVESYEIKAPEDTLAIERYLAPVLSKASERLAEVLIVKVCGYIPIMKKSQSASQRSKASASAWRWRSAVRWRKT